MLKTLEKIDKFYLLYISVMVIMAGIAIYTFQSLFKSFIDLNEVVSDASSQDSRVNEQQLDEAYDFVFSKNPVKLEIR
ncbi:MAG: hypothetical protein US62_C0007G0014 [Candidatus Woesebacteria bacterium GW2011_GWA1_37_8]|uniref:Uncharacterized protein n=2 Tax=Candidatus Woeseibacteriota TaxID=1752722 RepID=A0A0G0PD92_9BACT|nr:MAG: hypothetical protein US39_C0001G0096 [Microgenomates group bacterium GW2011_GWC1_37_12b]KKQ45939.1 MAG: hypothetical protein US62_C0007G0014 [Candidatus Woesebacteria bacterium GW2011_GWA1_37_8]KKQ87251.1 MAG: hypothetical protein UT10_C0008G0012 [Candidatus Woesebacteria bacterium GW2011_GWB1_38_8b]